MEVHCFTRKGDKEVRYFEKFCYDVKHGVKKTIAIVLKGNICFEMKAFLALCLILSLRGSISP